MLLFNLLILLLVIILSYIFKLAEIYNYDTQLIFILLTFTVLIFYKLLYYKYNIIKKKKENFNADKLNSFIDDKLTIEEELQQYKNKIEEYERIYGVKDILNKDISNDIYNLDNNISKLQTDINKDINKYNNGPNIIINNSEPNQNNKIDGDKTDTGKSNIVNVTTDTIKKALIDYLKSINKVNLKETDNGIETNIDHNV